MIGNDIAAALPELRAQAESLMTDSCDIHRATSVWSEALQKTVTSWAPVHLAVPCAFDVPPVSARALLTGEAVTPELPVVKVSVTVVGVQADDRVTVASGAVVWVTHVPERTNQVQRRLECRWVR